MLGPRWVGGLCNTGGARVVVGCGGEVCCVLVDAGVVTLVYVASLLGEFSVSVLGGVACSTLGDGVSLTRGGAA